MKSGAKIIIKNPSLGKYLFVLRDDNQNIPNPNVWSIIGGGIEQGETPLEALKREITEEIGIEVENIRELSKEELVFEFKGKKEDVESTVFYGETNCSIEEMTLTEGQRLEYFSIDELLKLNNVNPVLIDRINKYRHLLNE